jgi:hypothetical protein
LDLSMKSFRISRVQLACFANRVCVKYIIIVREYITELLLEMRFCMRILTIWLFSCLMCVCVRMRARVSGSGVCKVCGCVGVINTSHNPRVVVTLANS